MNLPIVDILRVGLSGLVFLLMFLVYRLLAREQAKKSADPTILANARTFLLTSVVLILVVALTGIGERYLVPEARTDLGECKQSLLRIQTLAAQPQQDAQSLRTLIANHVGFCEPALK